MDDQRPEITGESGVDPAWATHCAETPRPAPSRYEERVQRLLSVDQGQKSPVVFVGSSSIRLWETLETDFPAATVRRHGFGGSTMADAVAFLHPLVTMHDPAAVVLYSGENDIVQGLPPECVALDAERFINGLRAAGSSAPVYLLSIKTAPGRVSRREAFERANGYLEHLAAESTFVTFIEIARHLEDSTGKPRKEFYRGDRIHLNSLGYQRLRDLVGAEVFAEKLGPS